MVGVDCEGSVSPPSGARGNRGGISGLADGICRESVASNAVFFSFPNPVNENAARVVAGGVALLALLALVTQWWVLLPVLALGFLARVTTGPRFSPLARFATEVVAPRLPVKPVPGQPKRFAQGIGAAVTTLATVLHFGFGADGAVLALLAMLVVFATLESVFRFCVGCRIFAVLMRVGLIPESVCLECADVSRRLERVAS